MNNIEEQVEKLMDELMKTEAQEMIEDRVGDRATREAWRPDAEKIAASLLPLEVTDGEARTKPYRCADCDQPHGPFNNIGSGQSNKPEVTYRLVCDRCWGPKPAAPVEVTDEMVEAGAKANFEDRTMGREMEPWSEFKHDPRSEIWLRSARIVLSAALTQKGDNE